MATQGACSNSRVPVGQNVRLASELTGYKLDMMLEEEYRARQQNEAQQYLDMFVTRLDIEEDLAMALVEMGFTSLEEIAYVPPETFDEIELDQELVELLQSRAKEAALKHQQRYCRLQLHFLSQALHRAWLGFLTLLLQFQMLVPMEHLPSSWWQVDE